MRGSELPENDCARTTRTLRIRLLLAASAAAMLAGCTTLYWDMAPASPGFAYVVGMHNGKAAMWLCPDTPTGQPCQEVDVEGMP